MEGGPCEAACGETRAGRRAPGSPAVGRMPSGVMPKARPPGTGRGIRSGWPGGDGRSPARSGGKGRGEFKKLCYNK